MFSFGTPLLKKIGEVKATYTRLLFGSVLSVAALGGVATAQVNVLTQHNNISRTGANLNETALTISNVSVARFGKLFERPVDSNIWSQPLYVSGVNIPNKGIRNVVYVQTEVGQVYAFDADNASETAPLWRKDLAPNDFFDSVSTPVIDTTTQTLYCVVRHGFLDGDSDPSNDVAWFTFHGLDLTTGNAKFTPVTVQGSVTSNGAKGAVNGVLSFRANSQKQRPALLNLNGVIYAGFGGGLFEYYGSDATWNGWIFGFDAVTGAIRIVWCTTPDRNGAGIWQAGNGLTSDGTHIYLATGNGSNNPLSNTSHQGGRDYGNSLVRLTPNSAKTALSVTSFWTPYNFQYMEDADQDLGASGPTLIPGTDLLITGDKSGRGYVLNKNNLGGYTVGQNNIVQDLPSYNGHLHGGHVYYSSPVHGPVVYGWAEHDYLKAFKVLGNQGLETTPFMKSLVQVPPGMPGGNLSISANGSTNGTGILWASSPLIGDANVGIVPGVLRAFDANDLTKELWNSEIFKARDSSGFYAKFASPTIANGKVYLPTFYNPANYQGAKLVVYGLLPSVAVPSAPLNLTALAGLSKNTLSWANSTNATTYTLKRSTSNGGPYSVLATNLRINSYEDKAVNNGTTYYYVVTAENAGGSSANSNQASATPIAPISGQVISVNFQGGTLDFANNGGVTTSMGSSEVAGVVPVANWNNLTTASGTSNDLRANGGATTTADIDWTCAGIYATNVADSAGNNRMMKGYLSNSNTTDTTLTVTNLPANFTQNGYDVYVYSDGHNPTSTKTASYTIGGVTKKISDSQNRNFEGSFFTPGVADVGNYAVFTNLNTAQFTLLAARAGSTDNIPRAPINGIQIVARATTLGAPINLTAKAVNNGVWLNWNAVTGANTYRVLRATQSGGPYSTVAENLSVPRWSDPSALNGTTYFYVVNAISASNEISPPSNEASATPSSSYVGRVISMDLGGGGTTAMGATETAGATGVVKANWNSIFYSNGGFGDLKDDTGTATTTDAVWSNGLIGDMAITDSAGQNRMMRGYMAAAIGQVFEVNLYNIPPAFTSEGFDIYIYSDNYNGGARTAKITSISTNRGTAIIQITDPANTNFSGTYVNANYSNGNYGRVMNVTDANVTLRFENVSSADGWAGAAVNGIQIVARAAGSGSGSGFSAGTSSKGKSVESQ
jgi:hypothetical protein